MEELKCALLGFFGERIRPDGISPHIALETDPAQVAFVNDAVASVAQHIPLLRQFVEDADIGRIPGGFVSRSFALACGDLLSAYESQVLNLFSTSTSNSSSFSSTSDPCCIVDLQTNFGSAISKCADFIRRSSPESLKRANELMMITTTTNDFNDQDDEDEDEDDENEEGQNNQDDDSVTRTAGRGRGNRNYNSNNNNNNKSMMITVSEKWKRIHSILFEPLLPFPVRASMGHRVHGALIINIAQWMCYGKLLDVEAAAGGRNNSNNNNNSNTGDFFVISLQRKETGGGGESHHRPTAGDLAIDEWKIPHEFPLSLCSTILLAGRDRRQLDFEANQEQQQQQQSANNNNNNLVVNSNSNTNLGVASYSSPLRSFRSVNSRRIRGGSEKQETAESDYKGVLQQQQSNNNNNTIKENKQQLIASAATAAASGDENEDEDENQENDEDDENEEDAAFSSTNNKNQSGRNYKKKNNKTNLREQMKYNETPSWAFHLLCDGNNDIINNNNNNNGNDNFDGNNRKNPLISKNGELQLDELERRANQIRSSWARQLWFLVETRGALREELHAARDMFLCNRGDLWHTFVERSAPAVLGWTFSSASLNSHAADAALEIAQQQRASSSGSASSTAAAATMRWVLEAFRNSMTDVRLTDSSRHSRFEFTFNEAQQQQQQARASSGGGGGGVNSSTTSNTSSASNTSTTSAAAGGGGGGGGSTLDDIGRNMFSTIRLLGLKWKLPTALTHVIKPNTLVMYERLFVSNLALKFSVFVLNECKRFASQAQTLQSKAGRQFAHCVSLLHFFLSNVAYSWQVDVQDTHFRVMFESLDKAESVEEALRAHAVFIENLTAGAFLTEDGHEVARCIGELVIRAFSLFALAREDSTRRSLDQIALAESRNEPLGPRAAELCQTLERVVASVVRRVTTVISPIAASRRSEHRALWTRLDFNRWFTTQAEKLAASLPSSSSSSSSSQNQQQSQQQQNQQRFIRQH